MNPSVLKSYIGEPNSTTPENSGKNVKSVSKERYGIMTIERSLD